MKEILKYRITYCLLALLVLTISCEDFLDKRPENVVPNDEINYADKSLMFQPVSGVYSTFAISASSWSMYAFFVIRSDQLYKGGSWDGDQIELLQAQQFKYEMLPTYWLNEGSWTYFYDVIITCNSAIESLDKFAEYLTTDADKELNEEYKAQVRFIRAYSYFFMTRLWGDIPIFTDNSQVDGIHKSPRADVYKFIDDELAYCAKILPAKHPKDMPQPGLATKYTALGLKAKVAVDVDNWDAILQATETIINDGKFSLYNDFYQLFKKNTFLCSESLFELQFTDFGQSSGQVKAGGYAQNVQGPPDWIDNEAGKAIYGGWGFLPASDKLIDLMNTRGETIRKTTTLLFSAKENPDGQHDYGGTLYPYKLTPSGDQIFATAYKAYNGKAYVPSSQMTEGRPEYGCYNNFRMIRYADILLLNAEAKVRKGQNGDTPLNLVRQRAGMSDINGATLQQILDERDMELALEWGDRFYDLVRTGKAAQVLPNYTDAVRFYPIPRSQIDLNPNLGL